MLSAVWDDAAGKYHLQVEKHGQTVEDDADMLINASGFLNKWSWPKIPGIQSFQGKLVHSANWDQSLDWSNKRVAIIGNGSSGIQILPQMQPAALEIVNYIRSPTWMSPNFAAEFTPNGKNFKFSEEDKKKLSENSQEMLRMRKAITHSFNKFFYVMLNDSPEHIAAHNAFKAQMEERLGHDPELCAKLIPDYRIGCRRLSPGEDYLEAIQRPNVKTEFSEIKEVTAAGITTLDSKHDFDIIVCATGFDTSFVPPWAMVGRAGAVLAEQWKDHPEAYIGACVPNFPNYFIFNGPNSPVAHGSLLSVMDWTGDYIARWCKKIAADDVK